MGTGKKPVDYGMAEALAFASLVKPNLERQQIPVRLSGQDSRRGTFNQRHSVLLDIEDEIGICPAAPHRARPGAVRHLQFDRFQKPA